MGSGQLVVPSTADRGSGVCQTSPKLVTKVRVPFSLYTYSSTLLCGASILVGFGPLTLHSPLLPGMGLISLRLSNGGSWEGIMNRTISISLNTTTTPTAPTPSRLAISLYLFLSLFHHRYHCVFFKVFLRLLFSQCQCSFYCVFYAIQVFSTFNFFAFVLHFSISFCILRSIIPILYSLNF